MTIRKIIFTLLIGVMLIISGCAFRSSPQVLPQISYPRAIYPPAHYPFSQENDGLIIAAIPFAPDRDVFADPAGTDTATGEASINVLDAGVHPIRMIIWNMSEYNILIDTDQLFGIAGSTVFLTYPPKNAVDLVINSPVFDEALKGSRVGPMIGALLGGQVFVDVAREGITGLATGGPIAGTARATTGAVNALLSPAYAYEKYLTELISTEYNDLALIPITLYPGNITQGLIFLPSYAGIDRIRIVAYNLDLKKSIPVTIDIQ